MHPCSRLQLLLLIVVGADARYSYPDREPPAFQGLPTVKQMAAAAGYSATNVEVITEDGYSLWLHRIGTNKGPPVLFFHGICLTGETWIAGGADQALAYFLLRQGYDAWLANMRGTVYNEYSLKYKRNETKYWDFSSHEAGFYDLPAFIDAVLDIRGVKQLSYVSISLGTTVFLTMASSRPEYNSKINAAVLLAPIAYPPEWKKQTPLFRMATQNVGLLQRAVSRLRLGELLGRSLAIIEFMRKFCTSSSPVQARCLDLNGLMFGEHRTNIDMDAWDNLMPYFMAGSSFKTFIHALQIYHSGEFRQFDYGPKKNLLVYGSSNPPKYPLRLITAPVAFIWGNNDPLLDSKSIRRLANELPNLVYSREQPDPLSTHLDLLVGADINETVNPFILEFLNTFSSKNP